MKTLNRNPNDPLKDQENNTVFRSPMKMKGILVAFLMLFAVALSVSVILEDLRSKSIWSGAEARVLPVKPQLEVVGSEDDSPDNVKVPGDKLLGGLLTTGFDKRSCLSRYQSVLYRKALNHKPSPYLISRLRSYEVLHKRCGPNTEPYNKAIEQLRSGKQTGPSDCNYVVWISYDGLGNRILSLASAFLYSLLTNRVLLVDFPGDMTDLFCEPFPDVSWSLPIDFPLDNQLKYFGRESAHTYGNMLKNNILANWTTLPFVHLYLVHDYSDHDKLFFCDEDQSFLKRVPFLVMRSNQYFIPGLYLIPSFKEELSFLFPEKLTVFHFLGRYLFHPTNQVWGLVTRYYEAYLAKADEKIGIQIRVFDASTVGPFQQRVLDQIIACTFNENLLPQLNRQEHIISTSRKQKSKAVLMTSLSSGYFEKIKDMYWEYPTTTGDIIGIYQPSHEEHQQTEKQVHNVKAWAEINLLSMTDKLVTSAVSTFGYIAQGLGGLKPWILYKPENSTAPDPPCHRAMSMEPCFHFPPFIDCKKKIWVNTSALVPHVRTCEDFIWGLKLVDGSSE